MSATNLSKPAKPSLIARFRQLSLWKKGAIIIVILLLIWAGGVTVFGKKNNTSQYTTSAAQQGTIISSVDESGNVTASSQTSVTSPTDGLIQDVYVKNGDTVTKGEKLFSVRSTASAQVVASAYASYENALAGYNSATQANTALVATLEKDRQAVLDAEDSDSFTLADSGGNRNNPSTGTTYTQNEILSSQSQLTSANETFAADQTKYSQEGTAIAAANAALQSASLGYQATQDSVVNAPINGTVANLSVVPGAAVTASTVTTTSNSTSFSSSSTSSTNNGSSVLLIGNLTQLSILAQVNEVDVPNIKPGQESTVTLDAFPNQTFVGQVQSVDSVGAITSGVVTYNVYIALIAPPAEIKSGMSASIAIQTNRADNAIYVPTAAIESINGGSYVRVLKNKKVTVVPVTTGIADDTDTVIISGISVGDVVITGESTSPQNSNTSSPFTGITRGGFGGAGGGGGGGGARTGGGGGAAAR
jgi:macrolide-specific efflux system membrane fusion protein